MLTAIAAFAEAFANPLAPLLVLVLAMLLFRPALLRVASAGLGAALALPQLTAAPAAEIALGMLGGIAALLLYAELTLHLVLPALRLAKRCLVVIWELAVISKLMLPLLWRRLLGSGDTSPTLPPKDPSGP